MVCCGNAGVHYSFDDHIDIIVNLDWNFVKQFTKNQINKKYNNKIKKNTF